VGTALGWPPVVCGLAVGAVLAPQLIRVVHRTIIVTRRRSVDLIVDSFASLSILFCKRLQKLTAQHCLARVGWPKLQALASLAARISRTIELRGI
jgi:hypothetical protein